jgi:serine phosphatase RsbU (regulator of sigma subunit)/anti-sigma regulatory factor (Ser/Thr protein kinase)
MRTDSRTAEDADLSVHGTSFAALLLDGRGALLSASRSPEGFLGYSPEQLHGLSAWQLWTDSEACASALATARRGSATLRATVLRRADGCPAEASVHVLPLSPVPASEAGARFLMLVSLPAAVASPRHADVGPRARAAPGPGRRGQPRRPDLLREATDIDSSADPGRTAAILAELFAADFADVVMVDLAQAVLEGGDLSAMVRFGELRLNRAAAVCRGGTWPTDIPGAGCPTPSVPDSPTLREMQQGRLAPINDLAVVEEALGHDTDLIRSVLPQGAHSGLSVPLRARGLLLGCVTLWRTQSADPFDDADAALVERIASHVSLILDNARRYLREHRAAVALQSSLLPHALSHSSVAETSGMYVPATKGAGVSGDWFDVIPLTSLRQAFVIGDVVGHGINAAAAMGSLRTAVRTLADMDLEPEELLTRLDDLIGRVAAQHAAEAGSSLDGLGATCLYAVYDPGTRQCALASAGHPPPALVAPDGTVRYVEIEPGPPLGVGGMPFEPVEIELEPESMLVFFTDGLVGFPSGDIGAGMERLRRWLGRHAGRERAMADLGQQALAELLNDACSDDAAALFVRTRGLAARDTVLWEFPADPAVIAEARKRITRQLAAWQLDEMAFTTEVVASELVTNAIRYAGGPIRLRLIREHVLVCEVSDPSNTHPRLRHARALDEGGRGLFLVAQLTDRWGSRYSRSGKTIWTEQALPTPSSAGTPSGP